MISSTFYSVMFVQLCLGRPKRLKELTTFDPIKSITRPTRLKELDSGRLTQRSNVTLSLVDPNWLDLLFGCS